MWVADVDVRVTRRSPAATRGLLDVAQWNTGVEGGLRDVASGLGGCRRFARALDVALSQERTTYAATRPHPHGRVRDVCKGAR